MGFLPSIKSIINKLVKKILGSRVFNAAFMLTGPGQLFARHNYLNSNYTQHKYLYLPLFWFPPLSLVPFVMLLSGKFRKMPKSNKITLTDIFAWILISIIGFFTILLVPMISTYLMSDDKLGRLIDKFLPELFVNTIAKAAGKTLLSIIIIYLLTLFIEWIKYQKKCRRRQEKISIGKLFKASLIPTAAAAFVICTTNFFAPLTDILSVLSPISLPQGFIMAAAWLFFAQYNMFLSCAK